MRKILSLCLIYLLTLIIEIGITANASTDDYNTFSEIMMNEGKLLSDYTDEEINELLPYVQKHKFGGPQVYANYENIAATYISNTLYSVENKGSTDVVYEIDIEIETSNKTTFKASGSLNGSLSKGSTKEGNKSEIAGKCGLEYSNTSETSVTETQQMKLVVEGNSRAIVYLTGNLSVTNGVAAIYALWIKLSEGGFEIVTLQNQYSRVEKRAIWKGL